MFEFEDMSTGFHDAFLNKYSDSSGPILDFYISDSMQDMLDIDIRTEVATVVGGTTNEFASLTNDLPSLEIESNFIDGDRSWLGVPKLSALCDMYGDVGACVNPHSVMPILNNSSILNSSPKAQVNLNSDNYRSTPPSSPRETKSHLTFSPQQMKIAASIQENNKKSHLTSGIGLGKMANNRNGIEAIKKDLSIDIKKEKYDDIDTLSISGNFLSDHRRPNHNISGSNNNSNKNIRHQQQQNGSNGNNLNSINGNIIMSGGTTNTIKLAPGIGGLTFANSIAYSKVKQQQILMRGTSNGSGNLIMSVNASKRDRDTSSPSRGGYSTNSNNSTTINGFSNGTTAVFNNIHNNQNSVNSGRGLSKNVLIQNKNTSMNGGTNHHHHHHHHGHNTTAGHNSLNMNTSLSSSSGGSNGTSFASSSKNQKSKPANNAISEFPKPAYSYSCLIAMALKNSRSGSLPVSEIYSFMCEHFPYFKTAPNGWKNSVRHNLSLNKCFEKIEKPVTNGNQRKGCLWAMNPAKISKMDEEVQKWSRKDPLAIRKAMVYPEHLEALERGEMKHGRTGESDGENEPQSDTEENSESEQQDNDHDLDEHLIETPESVEDEDEDKEFDIEISDIYNQIDLEDDKDAIRLAIQNNNGHLFELTPPQDEDLKSPKRAKLDVNYSIAPAAAFEQHHHQHQQIQQNEQNSRQLTTNNHRRKMQLVNRII